MKSDRHTRALGVIESIILDADDRRAMRRGRNCKRDLARISESYTSESAFWTLVQNLAALDKLLLQAFESGMLPNARPSYGKKKGHMDRRPCFLHDLWAGVFLPDGSLRDASTICYMSVRDLRQIFTAFKKLEKEFSDEQLEKAISEFIRVDTLVTGGFCPPVCDNDSRLNLALCHDFVDEPICFLGQNPGGIDDSLAHITGVVVSALGEFKPEELKPRHGPGAVAELTGDGVYKYHFPTWSKQLDSVFPQDFFACHDHESDIDEREVPSRLIAVPKDCDGPRLIAAEPVANQWIQQGISGWMEDRIAKSFVRNSIALRDQGKNKAMAQEGSRTRLYATVDLSSASDRISKSLVDFLFARNPQLQEAIMACRTRMIRLPDGQMHVLKKFSTMGSALTFPVQSILFFCIALLSSCAVERGLFWRPRKADLVRMSKSIRVYGDDIIVPVDVVEKMKSYLAYFGLKVNSEKTFCIGRFRESCGGDYLDGVDVTPIKVKQLFSSDSPASLVAQVEYRNSFVMNGYPGTADYLMLDLAGTSFYDDIPFKDLGAGGFGFLTLDGDARELNRENGLRTRKNPKTFVHETKCVSLLQKASTRGIQSKAALFQFFTEEPPADSRWRSGARMRPKQRLASVWVASEKLYG